MSCRNSVWIKLSSRNWFFINILHTNVQICYISQGQHHDASQFKTQIRCLALHFTGLYRRQCVTLLLLGQIKKCYPQFSILNLKLTNIILFRQSFAAIGSTMIKTSSFIFDNNLFINQKFCKFLAKFTG